MEAVAFARDSASVDDITEHLRRCSADFVPPLKERVNIAEYAIKLRGSARTHEAWLAAGLIGLVAAYAYDADRAGFVSSVSVDRDHRGQGIAARLLHQAVADGVRLGWLSIDLEVSAQSMPAIHLYKTEGFAVVDSAGGILRMKYVVGDS